MGENGHDGALYKTSRKIYIWPGKERERVNSIWNQSSIKLNTSKCVSKNVFFVIYKHICNWQATFTLPVTIHLFEQLSG